MNKQELDAKIKELNDEKIYSQKEMDDASIASDKMWLLVLLIVSLFYIVGSIIINK